MKSLNPEELEFVQKIIGMIPEPTRKLFFLKCPRCGHRTWNLLGTEYIGYQAHYLGHLIEGFRSAQEDVDSIFTRSPR